MDEYAKGMRKEEWKQEKEDKEGEQRKKKKEVLQTRRIKEEEKMKGSSELKLYFTGTIKWQDGHFV